MSAEIQEDKGIDDGYLCYQTRLYKEFFVFADDLELEEQEQLSRWMAFTGDPETALKPHYPKALPDSSLVWYLSSQQAKTKYLKSLNPDMHFRVLDHYLHKKATPVLDLIASGRVSTHINLYFHLDVQDYPTGPFLSAESMEIIAELKASLAIYSSFIADDE